MKIIPVIQKPWTKSKSGADPGFPVGRAPIPRGVAQPCFLVAPSLETGATYLLSIASVGMFVCLYVCMYVCLWTVRI